MIKIKDPVPISRSSEAMDWCEENIGPRDVERELRKWDWGHDSTIDQLRCFWFRKEEDAILFLLKWS